MSTGNSKGGSKSNSKGKAKTEPKARARAKAKAKAAKCLTTTECYLCGKRATSHETVGSRANHNKMVNKIEVEKFNAETGKELVFTIDQWRNLEPRWLR